MVVVVVVFAVVIGCVGDGLLLISVVGIAKYYVIAMRLLSIVLHTHGTSILFD